MSHTTEGMNPDGTRWLSWDCGAWHVTIHETAADSGEWMVLVIPADPDRGRRFARIGEITSRLLASRRAHYVAEALRHVAREDAEARDV